MTPEAGAGTPSPREAPLDPGYLGRIRRGLDAAFAEADELEIEAETARIVIFSDHHKGVRDGADDFARCESAYCAALGYYLEAGYRLFVLGDVEELWENDARPVVNAYRETLRLEAEFHRAGRYERFWGNHDDDWAKEGAVRDHLHPLFPGLRVREALKLRVKRREGPSGLLFLVHGHQGTDDSDRFAVFSRIVVRNFWRPIQRRAGITGNTPAKDFNLRAKHDRAMFEWARKHPSRPVLIAGHTHRPVFWQSKPDPPRIREPSVVAEELRRLREAGADPSTLAALRAELELAHAEARNRKVAFNLDPPCYFNTGCASFGDGDVTAIEIAGGEIKLVRWPDDEGKAAPKLLSRAEPLGTVLEAVARPPAAAPGAREVVIQ